MAMKVKSILSFRSILVLAFSLYCCSALQKLYSYEIEYLIDSKSIKEGFVTATSFLNNGSTFTLSKSEDNFYQGEVVGLKSQIEILKLLIPDGSRKINKAWLDEREISSNKILDNSKLVGANWGQDPYYNFEVVKTGSLHDRAPPYWIFAGISIWFLYLIFNRQEYQSSGPLFLKELVFSGSIFNSLNWKDYTIIFCIYLLTAFITVGCDALPMLNMLVLSFAGEDIYQYQVAHKYLLNYEFLNWPYNPFFLALYTFFSAPWATLTINSAPILGYQHIQMLGAKTLNFVLLLSTALSIISYAIDSRYLKKNIKAVFYLCFLNPAAFYVSILFLQLDIVPLYLVTMGLLLLTKDKINIFNSAFLLALGLSCKLQNLLLLGPILLASLLIFVFNETKFSLKRRFLNLALHSGTILGILLILTKPFKGHDQAFYQLVSNFSQTARLWLTVIVYADGGLYIYMTILFLILMTIFHCSFFHSKLSKSEIVTNILFMMAITILTFSFAHMNTPSTLIQASVGLFLLTILKQDSFQRIFIFCASTLILGNALFNDIGDITRVIGWNQSFFTEMYRVMPHEKKVKYTSLLFSIANSSMLAFAFLMLKVSLDRLKKEFNPEGDREGRLP